MALARATLRNVRQTVVVGGGLNRAFPLTTIAGVLRLWPEILADTGKTVLDTLAALRLFRWRAGDLMFLGLAK